MISGGNPAVGSDDDLESAPRRNRDGTISKPRAKRGSDANVSPMLVNRTPTLEKDK